jgi:hypothetical protein
MKTTVIDCETDTSASLPSRSTNVAGVKATLKNYLMDVLLHKVSQVQIEI